MRHTIEEKRKMRNARKKRKRHHKSELKRAALIKDALREVQRKTDEQRSIASKYYKLWRRSVENNKKLQNKLDNRETNIKKVYKYQHVYHNTLLIIFSSHTFIQYVNYRYVL